MALKFLNKKGWHTGSLRNIETVWKAEQKNEQEQRKLEELRKQIHEERERDEFRLLQQQAGFTPVQERLEFLYDSGLSVGKSSSDGFKTLEPHRSADNENASSASASASASAPDSNNLAVPGALFEEDKDKPQSANDAWRKLHSDPLLMIRQREQEAMLRIKNNPMKMAMIRKSMETTNKGDEALDGKHEKVKSKHKKCSSSKHHSDSENDTHEEKERRRKAKLRKKEQPDSDDDSRDRTRYHRHSKREHEGDKRDEDLAGRARSDRHIHRDYGSEKHHRSSPSNRKPGSNEGYYPVDHHQNNKHELKRKDNNGSSHKPSDSSHSAMPPRPDSYKRRGRAPQLSEEERAARLREMQMDAELHDEQRWKRLKKAAEDDAREASHSKTSRGGSFLDAAQRSVYGTEKGGSSTIEESVRRRTHFRQGRSDGDDRNAFRR